MDDVVINEMKSVASKAAQKILKEKCGLVKISNDYAVVSRSERINIWKYKAVHRFKEEEKIFFIVKEQVL